MPSLWTKQTQIEICSIVAESAVPIANIGRNRERRCSLSPMIYEYNHRKCQWCHNGCLEKASMRRHLFCIYKVAYIKELSCSWLVLTVYLHFSITFAGHFLRVLFTCLMIRGINNIATKNSELYDLNWRFIIHKFDLAFILY